MTHERIVTPRGQIMQVMQEVCDRHGLTLPVVLGRGRTPNVAGCRWEIMVRLKDDLGLSFNHIARLVNREHTGVSYGYWQLKAGHLPWCYDGPPISVAKSVAPAVMNGVLGFGT